MREGCFPVLFEKFNHCWLGCLLYLICTTPYCFLVNPFIKYSSLQLNCLSLKSTFWHKTCSVTKSDTWTIKLERFRKFRIHSSGGISRPSNVLRKKTIPLTSFYCIFHLVWIPMTTTQNMFLCDNIFKFQAK